MSRDVLLPGLSVSRETTQSLHDFADRLLQWTQHINLIAPATTAEVWERHILDCAQLFPLAQGLRWADLGAGGGLPGLVLAILAKELAPERQHILIESDKRKAAFLLQTTREMGLNCQILIARAEAAHAADADVVTARALAPLIDLLPLVERHVAREGCALLPKGRAWATEVATARQSWAFTVQDVPSQTSAEARILRLSDVKRQTIA
jgi:16S rRNA (guanine527-N7)-methyltransferase